MYLVVLRLCGRLLKTHKNVSVIHNMIVSIVSLTEMFDDAVSFWRFIFKILHFVPPYSLPMIFDILNHLTQNYLCNTFLAFNLC